MCPAGNNLKVQSRLTLGGLKGSLLVLIWNDLNCNYPPIPKQESNEFSRSARHRRDSDHTLACRIYMNTSCSVWKSKEPSRNKTENSKSLLPPAYTVNCSTFQNCLKSKGKVTWVSRHTSIEAPKHYSMHNLAWLKCQRYATNHHTING